MYINKLKWCKNKTKHLYQLDYIWIKSAQSPKRENNFNFYVKAQTFL